MGDGSTRCGDCQRRVSPTAGTIFHRTRTPLSVWFAAAWYMTTQKQGISALGLQRVLGLGSYQTAWTLLHRYRTTMTQTGRTPLSGTVEADETFVGGVKSGKRGRGAAGKVIVLVAAEVIDPEGFGRARMQVIPNVKAPALRRALVGMVEPGSTIVSDAYGSYPTACKGLYTHQQHNIRQSGGQAHELLPAVHRAASLLKRWLLGTHQGSYTADHIQSYLDEFVFRYNRRTSRQRGLLFYRLLEAAAIGDPVAYRDLVANSKKKKKKPKGVKGPKPQPRSLHQPSPGRPWRTPAAQKVKR